MILWEIPSSRVHLFIHATVLLNSASPSHPCLCRMILFCFRQTLKPSATETIYFGAISTLRECDLPYGLHDSLCTLHLLCSPDFHPLRHKRNTRYGWLAKPFPTGTYTLQDAPSFAWRSNVAICGNLRGAKQRVNCPTTWPGYKLLSSINDSNILIFFMPTIKRP